MGPEAFSRMLALFIDDSSRQLDSLTDDLTLLAQDPEHEHVLERARRTVHTVKGSAAMLALRTSDEDLIARLNAVSHLARIAEDRFVAALEGVHPLTEWAIDVLSDVPTLLRTMLREADAGAVAALRDEATALEDRIAATGTALQALENLAIEAPTKEELEALFEADATVRGSATPASDDTELATWLWEHIRRAEETAPPLVEDHILRQLEEDAADSLASATQQQKSSEEILETIEVSGELLPDESEFTEPGAPRDYHGEMPFATAVPSRQRSSSDLGQELKEAAALLDETVSAPVRERPADGTEDEGTLVVDTLAYIIGTGERQQEAAEPEREKPASPEAYPVVPPSTEELSTTEAATDERDLAELIELDEQEREEPDAEEVEKLPGNVQRGPVQQAVDDTTAPKIERTAASGEEAESIAELLGLEDEGQRSAEEAAEGVAPPTVQAGAEQPKLVARGELLPSDQEPMRAIFLQEARQLLDELNQDLVCLEQSPVDAEILHRVLRAAHTLKGSAATVGYRRIGTVAHRMEDVLQRARDEKLPLDANAIDILLGAMDRIDELTKEIAQHGEERREIEDVVTRLESVYAGARVSAATEPSRETGLGSVQGISEQVTSAEADALREVFTQEARELLDLLGRELVTLEQQPDDTETVHHALRAAHTLKGSAAMLGHEHVRTLAHALEDALQVIRDGHLTAASDTVDLMLGAVDALDGQLNSIARTASEPPEGDTEDFARRLKALASELLTHTETESGPTSATVEKPEARKPELDETFLEEAHTQYTALTRALLALEQNPSEEEARHEFAGAALALTGSAAPLGLQRLADVAGHMEAIIRATFERNVALDADILNTFSEGVEALGALLVTLRNERHDRSPDVSPLLTRLRDARIGGSTVKSVPIAPEQAPPKEEQADNRRVSRRIVEVDLDRLNQLMNLAAELVISRTRLSTELERLSGVVTVLSDEGHDLSDVERKLTGMRGDRRTKRTTSEGVLRGFSEGEFDRFSDMDVVIRDLHDSSTSINDLSAEFTGMASNFDQNITRISTIAKDLHDEILRVRMVRVERAFTRIPRIIRDAARNESKQVNLVLEGTDTEMDKNILEAMNNPLLHLLRNAVGHGIEPPDERQARGKPEAGKVTVRATQDGNQIVIQVSDDGRGIDPDRVRRAAVERNLLSEDQANALNDGEVVDLIFEPGFSTSEKVSELSGRGVGLDVVRSVVSRFNGTVSVDSSAGRGATFRIALPLTLAIGQALLVEATGRQFALPLASVTKIEQVARDEVIIIKDQPYIYRENVPIPLTLLGEALGVPNTEPLDGKSCPVVLIREGERQTALAVDRIVGREDIVIKTLGDHLRRVPGISGATILGDGSVVMILNVPHLLSAISTAHRRTSVTPTRGPIRRGTSPTVESAPSPDRVAHPQHVGEPPPPTEKSSGQALPKGKPRVLVVDDSISIRKYISGVLERGGYDVITANDGADAWEKLQAEECRLVISDLEMPRMHGYELIAEIKKEPKTRHIPVVFLTARAGEKHHRMGLELGATAFLNKPFSEGELLRLVQSVVS